MIGKPFLPGRAKTGGRIKGSRNKISEAFLHDLAGEWEVSGPATQGDGARGLFWLRESCGCITAQGI